MERVTQRCSTIFIAVGNETHVYRSVDEVPEELRQKLLDSTRGMNSATILIADKGGREEILRALHSPDGDADQKLTRSLTAPPPVASGRRFPNPRISWMALVKLLLAGCLGYLFWMLLSVR